MFFNVELTSYCRLDILICLLTDDSVPVMIAEQVKIISDRFLAASIIFEICSKSSLIDLYLLIVLSRLSLLYIIKVQ